MKRLRRQTPPDPGNPTPSRQAGFSLVEVLVSMGLLVSAVVWLAQFLAMATLSNISARSTTFAAVLAAQKMEQLRALTWGFDVQGRPLSDTTTDITVVPEAPGVGSGLSESPPGALTANTVGCVDYLDASGRSLGGGAGVRSGTVYIRRWSIEPLPGDEEHTLVFQVLVTRTRDRGDADQGAVRRLPDEARLVSIKTRKAS